MRRSCCRALIASIAGVLYVYYNRFINPVAASFQISVEVALMAIVGGSGTILGPFIGAGIILVLRNWVSSFFELHTAVMGIVFIVDRALGAAAASWASSTRWRAGDRKARGRHDAPPSQIDDLAKVFGGLRAVDGVSLAGRARRAARADRAERRRQDHAVPLHHRHACSRPPGRCCCSATTSPICRSTGAPRSAWAARFRSPTCSPT